jgi:hypothetical protein
LGARNRVEALIRAQGLLEAEVGAEP